MNYKPLNSQFLQRIKTQLPEESDALLHAINSPPPVSIRRNPHKTPPQFSILHSPFSIIPWCPTGYYLDERPSFTLDPLFHAGCYYVQEASSMFLEAVIRQLGLQEQQITALDACAAPGGKSTHLLSLLTPDSLLISNETIASRAAILKENIIKWGHPNVLVTNNDPSAFTALKNQFDLIVVDAPCSGEGMFRKDKTAMDEWSPSNCDLCVSRQRRILSALLPSLKEGGYLLYCTCTYNPEENEQNVQWMLNHFALEHIPLRTPEGVVTAPKGYYFYPHRIKGEGFYICALQKTSVQFKVQSSKFKENSSRSSRPRLQRGRNKHKDWKEYLKIIHNPKLSTLNYQLSTAPHELAMSIHPDKATYPTLELTKEQALQYLRKAPLPDERQLIATLPKGITLITHQSVPLGFAKILENRLNNYYPSEWRIRNK